MLGVPLFSISLEDTLMDGSQIAGNASLPNQEQLALPPPAGTSSDERGLGAARRRLFLASMATAQNATSLASAATCLRTCRDPMLTSRCEICVASLSRPRIPPTTFRSFVRIFPSNRYQALCSSTHAFCRSSSDWPHL